MYTFRMGRCYRASVTIQRSQAVVWERLVDLPGHAQWDPLVRRIEGTLEVGGAVHMMVDLGGKLRPQTEYVRKVKAPESLHWGKDWWPPWMLRGHRTQELRDLGEGRTSYVTEDHISGLLSPLVHLFYGAVLQTRFEEMAMALKEICERDEECGNPSST